jgi:ribosomal-protein-alanine N-acetyltransferase
VSVPGGPLQVRPMRRADVPAVYAIERDVHQGGWSAAVFRDELERGDRSYVVAESDGELVGYAGLLQVLDEGHIANVAVARSRQGMQVGRRLVLELHRIALQRGITALTLEVRAGNEPAKALYRRFGYAPVGVRKGYYADGEDALIMWVHDIDAAAHAQRLAAIEQSLAAIEQRLAAIEQSLAADGGATTAVGR